MQEEVSEEEEEEGAGVGGRKTSKQNLKSPETSVLHPHIGCSDL